MSEPKRGGTAVGRFGRGSTIGLGVAVIWISLLVLLPLAAVVVTATEDGWSGFWKTVTSPSVLASLRLTVLTALAVTVVNAFMGTLVAWVLVRDRFPGKRILEVVVDLPFALPTIVAGLVLLTLYGPNSPIGLNLANSRPAVFLAMLFVTVPFVIRTVEPVLIELDPEVELAAASLGAGRFVTFRRIVLPNLVPAIASGSALSFARGISEYGSVVLISGNLPFRTEIASVRILTQIENDKTASAAAVATVLLVVALVVLVVLDLLQRWASRRA